MKTHYTEVKSKLVVVPACGAQAITVYGADAQVTTIKDAVTCGRCRRTRTFKTAKVVA